MDSPRSIVLFFFLGFAFPTWLEAAWEKIHPLGRPTSEISDLAYGNGEWIAVGGRGLITRLAADDRWAEIASPVGVDLNDVLHTGDRFIAIGDKGAILLSSPSAVAVWTLAGSGVSQRLLHIEKFDSEFIILGENGLVLRSIDGVTWDIRRPADTYGPKFQALVKLNSEYVAIEGRRVWRSPDAANWTLDATADSKVDYVQNARVLNNQLVAWGDFRGMARSEDGRQWTTIPCPLGDSSDAVTDIIFANGRYLLTGSDRFQEESRPIYTSTNLTTWTATDGTAARRILAGDAQIVATSLNGHEVSTDGLLWRLPDAHLFQPVVFSGGAFRAADRGFLHSSPDGRAWTRALLPAGVRASAGIQQANGRHLVFSGTRVSVSTDLANWQSTTLPGGGFVGDFQYTLGKYYALLPRTSFSFYSTIAHSSDGLSWTLTSSDSSQLASSGSRLVGIYGASNVFYSNVSANGTTFTRYSYNQPAPSDIAFGNGVFVAVSPFAGYEIRRSTDGVTWSPVPLAHPGPQSISFVNGRFVARSHGGLVLSSTDGLAWNSGAYPLWTKTRPDSGGQDVAYGNGVWLLSKNIPLLSTDLQVFEPLTPPIDQNFVRTRYSNGHYWALSDTRDNITTGTLWRSPDGAAWTPLKRFDFNPADIVMSPSLCIVFSDFSEIAISSDLVNWQTISGGLGRSRAAAFHQGKFYAATQSGVRRSPDGLVWEAGPGLPGFDAYDVLSSPLGLTVAGSDGYRGLAYHSPDGETWTRVWSSAPPQYLTSLAYADGRVIAGGDYGYLISSFDGLTWSAAYTGDRQGTIAQSVGTASGLLSISDGALRRASYADLSSHREEPIPARLNSVAHGNGVSIAVGTDSSLYRDTSATSSPAPADFSVSNTGDRYLDLAWNANSSIAGFVIEYRVVGAADWKRLDAFVGATERGVRLPRLTPETSYELRIIGLSSGHSPSNASATPTIVATFSPLAHWRKIHFGDPANTGLGADVFDADHDGIPNLVEYALGHSPRQGNPAPLTASAAPSSYAGYFNHGVEFWCDALNSDIDYVVERSNDLQTWTLAGTSFAGTHFQDAPGGSSVDPYYYPEHASRRKVKVTVNINQPSQFFRLRIVPKNAAP